VTAPTAVAVLLVAAIDMRTEVIIESFNRSLLNPAIHLTPLSTAASRVSRVGGHPPVSGVTLRCKVVAKYGFPGGGGALLINPSSQNRS
jgi:hypothetical protein